MKDRIARQVATKGWGGLAWAAGIPGTLGGAVVGNAGAHGGDLAGNLQMAEILHLNRGREIWPAELRDEVGILLDDRGKLLGSEVLPASKYLPESLLRATSRTGSQS